MRGEQKNVLCHAFPLRHNFAEIVVELVTRKMPAEMLMQLALCKQCHFMGKKALSFIIRGLPLELQGNACVFK